MTDPPVTTIESEPPDWQPIPARLEYGATTALTKRQLRNWGLVLEARHIQCCSVRRGLRWQLLVPAEDFDVALKELRQYETENHGWPPPPPPNTPLTDNRVTTLWILILLGAFHDLTLNQIELLGHHPVDWSALGNAHAGKILNGQWWRSVTALTLHADWQHLLGNLVIGGIFIARLCRDLRSGPAWLLLLAAGVFGNLINAWVQHPDHRAVGASTAIFGVVGLLAAISVVRYRHNLRARRRWTLPVAAALGLLAMLGAGGENTDLGAHLFGFLFGLPLGVGAELLVERYGRPGRVLSTLLALTAGTIVVAAWWLALGTGA
ncbi:MAG: rhomboid family intramembrane serine protease [Desulfuromonadales bacterium]|nr:rhomboid family intramembrane serine protease [Desulfuromonadales bacterium]